MLITEAIKSITMLITEAIKSITVPTTEAIKSITFVAMFTASVAVPMPLWTRIMFDAGAWFYRGVQFRTKKLVSKNSTSQFSGVL
jgi:hypothetical protein